MMTSSLTRRSVVTATVTERELQLQNEIRDVTFQRDQAIEALQYLADGVRLITRQMKQPMSPTDDECSGKQPSNCAPMLEMVSSEEQDESSTVSWATVPTVASSTGDGCLSPPRDQRLQQISTHPLWGLQNAASVVEQHLRLSSIEASTLTEDVQDLQNTTERALQRAAKAEAAVVKLHKESKRLKQSVLHLKKERRLLAKQCKQLQETNQELEKNEWATKRQEQFRALETYVQGALTMHERQLAAAARNASPIRGQRKTSGCENSPTTVKNDHPSPKKDQQPAPSPRDFDFATRPMSFAAGMGLSFASNTNRILKGATKSTLSTPGARHPPVGDEASPPSVAAATNPVRLTASTATLVSPDFKQFIFGKTPSANKSKTKRQKPLLSLDSPDPTVPPVTPCGSIDDLCDAQSLLTLSVPVTPASVESSGVPLEIKQIYHEMNHLYEC